MKKFLQRVVLVAVAMATAQVAVAESWRINNDPAKGAHFVDINAAMASEDVVDGDVLYLDPGCVLGEQTITKAVTVIGTGWDFNDRPYGYAQISANLVIKAAARVVGLYITGNALLHSDNIVIERCRIDLHVYRDTWNSACNNLQLISSYLPTGVVRGMKADYGQMSYTIISNCVISSNDYYDGPLLYLHNATVTNCYLVATGQGKPLLARMYNSSFKNNIMINISGSNIQSLIEQNCSGNNFSCNCMSAETTTTYASANVCTNSIDISTYVINDGAAGGAWAQLCEGSPAIGAGEGGIDCGPYAKGSLYPFVTYGMPKHIPYFTEAVVPAQPTDGKVKVSLKIVNQND